ncbi:MAG TPA: glycine cleavage T C-terminal barrel domain-containing protein, partial [Phycisphaerales bacterium]|nr:glycine cleavage T C-terminal barrel domain-containing protein [Phycisphaerales bacterium]
DQPQRGTIGIRGPGRLEFLGRMLTQDLRGFEPLHARRAFWLNRKGRIDADLRLLELGKSLPSRGWPPELAGAGGLMLADLDVHAVDRTLGTLGAFLLAEEVELVDETASLHRLAVHGPKAGGVLDRAAETVAGPPAPLLGPGQGALWRVRPEGPTFTVERQDSTGAPGFELTVPTAAAGTLFAALRAAGAEPCGWLAYNTARIEAGWPLYNIDFGPSSLPAETGVMSDRVSLTKGCYLGQEVVARMHSLGRPKQRLVALVLEREAETSAAEAPQPGTGAAIALAPEGDPVGAVTSSTLSPRLGSATICLAMVRFQHAAPGAELFVSAGARWMRGRVAPGLSVLA